MTHMLKEVIPITHNWEHVVAMGLYRTVELVQTVLFLIFFCLASVVGLEIFWRGEGEIFNSSLEEKEIQFMFVSL